MISRKICCQLSLGTLIFLFRSLCFAEEESTLFIDGGMYSILATKKAFAIEVSDQVSDGCLPNPTQLKNTMEISLRQNRLSIDSDTYRWSSTLTINAVGYELDDFTCVVYIEAYLDFSSSIEVPYAADAYEENITVANSTVSIGGYILTGDKSSMQQRLENTTKELGDDLFLLISRAYDHTEDNFPEIIESYEEQTGD